MKLQTLTSKHERNFKLQAPCHWSRASLIKVWNFVLLWSLVLGCWCFVSQAVAQEWLDKVDDALYLQTPDGSARVDLSGTVDLEGYFIHDRAPGLIYSDDDFFNPRLSLFLDARWGKHLYSFVQARVDRGFDPHSEVHDARFDEYLLRYTPFNEPWVNLQVGKFATAVGRWVDRHDSWNNPFITAPMPYQRISTVADVNVAPTTAAFLARRDIPDKKDIWQPLVWGPSYTSGASVFGTVEKFDYAFEFKNASLSSRPEVWDATDLGWENPTYGGRLGFRPDAAWNLGASFSRGAYLQPDARNTAGFPAGRSLGDFKETTFAGDVSYAWHHLQLWGEAFFTRFQVPHVGDADTVAYFIEAKYKITTKLYGALRWNQELFGNVSDGTGGQTEWDRDSYAIDAALGYRFTRHLQAKIQYSYNHQNSSLQQGDHLAAAQVTLKF